jgi:hypothetical protein
MRLRLPWQRAHRVTVAISKDLEAIGTESEPRACRCRATRPRQKAWTRPECRSWRPPYGTLSGGLLRSLGRVNDVAGWRKSRVVN